MSSNKLILLLCLISFSFSKWSDGLVSVLTEWGEKLDKENPLPEYPRPQFVRESFLSLNGIWQYSLKENDDQPKEYDGDIVVPFSIESPLSGVGDKSLQPGNNLWYRRVVDLTKIKNLGRFIINFGAVDQTCEVFVNGKKVGDHDGGYTSFSFEITSFVGENLKEVEIIVKVQDNLCKDGAAIGKQRNPRGGIWYVNTGGIWQSVWIESVPKTYIESVKITPLYDQRAVKFFLRAVGDQKITGEVKVLSDDGKEIDKAQIKPNIESIIKMPRDFRSWSPEDPYLYNVHYSFGDDQVDSYFGMRKFSMGYDSKGINRILLNNKPYFMKGLLDQGYWSDGYYTAPSDDAIIFDIQTMKDMGFNMLRKHIKIEPYRWYYHCDRLGMLVWQDQVSGWDCSDGKDHGSGAPDSDYYQFERASEIGRKNYYRDLVAMMDKLYNCPCISTWVPFNEGWGQFDSVITANYVKGLDPTRLVDHASGWVDHNGPDFKSHHIYSDEINFGKDDLGRPIVLSEYGGYGFVEHDHCGSEKQFAYKMFDSKEELNDGVKTLITGQILRNIENGLCASVYTQVSDVEDEVNGMLTYDRKVIKLDVNMMKEINDKLVIDAE